MMRSIGLDQSFSQGVNAVEAGKPITDNPYEPNTELAKEWARGYKAYEEARERYEKGSRPILPTTSEEELIETILNTTPGRFPEKMDEVERWIEARALAKVYRWRWLWRLLAAAEIAFFAFVLVGIVLIVWKYGYGG